MRATVIRRLGGPEVLVVEEVDEPVPGPGEIVVEVGAAGLNFIDTYHRTGLYPARLPFTPGLEAAGTVASVGSSVSDLATGDRVAFCSILGAYAERAVVPADQLVPVPEEVSLDTAAASHGAGTHRPLPGDRDLPAPDRIDVPGPCRRRWGGPAPDPRSPNAWAQPSIPPWVPMPRPSYPGPPGPTT